MFEYSVVESLHLAAIITEYISEAVVKAPNVDNALFMCNYEIYHLEKLI